MELLINIFKLLLNIFYFFIKLFPTNKNKIVFISRQTNKPSLDFRLLIKKLKQNKKIKIVTLNKRIEKNIFAMTIKNFPMMIRQMYHLSTSHICITDGYNITISNLKHKKNLIIIQMWHSMGAIKKFGHQTLYSQKSNMIAECLNMHKNYDYIIAGTNQTKGVFAKAFNENENKIISLGLPRIDYLLNNREINKKIIYSKYPNLKNKKIIMYAPTFRNEDNYKFNELINNINLNKYILIIKKHPNIKCSVPKHKNVFELKEFGSLQLLSITDYLITDYSAIILESAILNIKTFLWVYDYNSYSKKPGLNIDLFKEFKKYTFKDINALYKVLDNNVYDIKQIQDFYKKYGFNNNQNITGRIVDFIMEVKNYEKNTIGFSQETSFYHDFNPQNEISFR